MGHEVQEEKAACIEMDGGYQPKLITRDVEDEDGF
jgi:hypothetical protein